MFSDSQRIKIKKSGQISDRKVTAWKFSTQLTESVGKESFYWGRGNTTPKREVLWVDHVSTRFLVTGVCVVCFPNTAHIK